MCVHAIALMKFKVFSGSLRIQYLVQNKESIKSYQQKALF